MIHLWPGTVHHHFSELCDFKVSIQDLSAKGTFMLYFQHILYIISACRSKQNFEISAGYSTVFVHFNFQGNNKLVNLLNSILC